ncbi:MAG: response regulator transcription factor [Acidimicrobiaceae bacterium]|nr:response regulator transcription factor [Acidimicrobiaceae bacterium]
MTRILVVDDDLALLRALRIALQRSGYDVVTSTTGQQGIAETATSSPDVVVLDLGLPDLDGVTVCRRIREWSDVPIIVLSAADAETRKVAALDEGADDYVTKPFGMAELEARVRAALRHRAPRADEQPSELSVGPLQLDLVHRETRLHDRPVRLTAREFELLSFLARHAGKVCTHQMILEAVWGNAYAKEIGYLHAYVHRIRQKLKPSKGIRIETTPGIGYVLRSDEVPS